MKGLKRRRNEDVVEGTDVLDMEDVISQDDDSGDDENGGVELKRTRVE